MEHYIGIDLGTTYSAVSTIDEYGKPVILKNSRRETLTPSVIYFGEDGQYTVGSEAKEMLLYGEENVAMFFKRNMGNSDFYLNFHGKSYSSTDLSAILLSKLKADAELALGAPVKKAVITVPAYFNDLQRNETIRAAQRAGLEVLRIINEPTAAAIAYGSNQAAGKKILVYDLGGGTFDVTVLLMTEQSIQVLSTGGDHELGGKDWDDKLLTFVADEFINEFNDDPLESIESYNDLAFQVEVLKKQLSNVLTTTFSVSYNGNKGKYEINRKRFEELSQDLLHRTTFKAQEVLYEANLSWSEIDGVLLVGGATKMPMVTNWVKEMSGKEPLRGINVDEAVCMGAAIQAQLEVNKIYSIGGKANSSLPYSIRPTLTIYDVMSHSLGLIAVNADSTKYINSIIIPKNLPIPSSEKRPFKFKTRAGDDNKLDVYITQGEVEDVASCIIVSKYIFEGIEHIAKDETIIDIEYQYDENGIISVEGTQRETGKRLTAIKCPLSDDMHWLYEEPALLIPHTSVVLAIDISVSMTGEPLKKAMEAARNFVDNMDLTNASVGLVAFSNEEKVLCPLTQNTRKISNGIKNIRKACSKWGAGTDGKPLALCYSLLKPCKGNRFIIVLTDGEWTHKTTAINSSRMCAGEGIEIIAIGFGTVDKKFLEDIATSTENAFMANLNNLVHSFGNIAQVLTEGGLAFKLK